MIYDSMTPPLPYPRTRSEALSSLLTLIEKRPLGTLIISIDPGDVHVGVCLGVFDANADVTPTVLATEELTQAEVLFLAATVFRKMRYVVMEYFALYGSHASTLIGSTMPTCRLIGALEYIACVAVEGTYDAGQPIRPVARFLYEQPASIQDPMRSQLRARNLTSHARSNSKGDHALSAELHFYYFCFTSLTNTEAATPSPTPAIKPKKAKKNA